MQLGRFIEEIQRTFRSTSRTQWIVTGAVVLLGAAALVGLVLRTPTARLVPLTDDSSLSPSELADARAQLSKAGLTMAQVRDGRLMVPADEREQYRDAVGDVLDAPRTWADTWEQANSTLNQFSLAAERDDVKEITRARMTSRLLNELPGVEQADVVWDEEQQRGWNRPPLVHATVYLKPRPGRQITLDTVHAVRVAVAGSKAYLDPDDVVVMDLSRMVAFDRETLGEDFSARYGEITRLTTEYRQRAESAVADIPGASVAVVVEPVVATGSELPASASPPHQSEPNRPTPDRSRVVLQGGPNIGLEISPEPLPLEPAEAGDEPSGSGIPVATDEASTAPTTRHRVNLSVSIPATHYRQLGRARRLLPAATREEALQSLADIEHEVTDSVRERLTHLNAESATLIAAPVVTVQTIEADDVPDELLVAPAAAPTHAATVSLLDGPRNVLMAVTMLIAIWLGWTVFQKFAQAAPNRRSAVLPQSPLATVGHQVSEQTAPASGDPAGILSDFPREQFSEILQADDDAVFVKRYTPATESSAGAPARQDSTTMRVEAAADVAHDEPRETPHAIAWDIDELAALPDSQLRKLVRSLAIDTWPAALSPAAPSTRQRLLSALPDDEAGRLRDVLSQRRPIRLDDIDRAQQEVLTALSEC